MSSQELLMVVRRYFPVDAFPKVEIEREPGKGKDGKERMVVTLNLTNPPSGQQGSPRQEGAIADSREANAQVLAAMKQWHRESSALVRELETVSGAFPVVVGMRRSGSYWKMAALSQPRRPQS